MRICPRCGSSKGAALSNQLKPGDFLICANCGLFLKLDSETNPVAVPDNELADPANQIMFDMLSNAVRAKKEMEKMSKEAHPNINAAAFTSDIIRSYLERLRGPAVNRVEAEALAVLLNRLPDFVVQISVDLDRAFGIGDVKWTTD